MGHLPEAGGGMGPDQAGEARGGMWAGRRRRAWGVGGRPEPDLGESRLLTVPQGHGGWKDAPWVVGDGDESGAAGEIGNFISELLYPKEKKKVEGMSPGRFGGERSWRAFPGAWDTRPDPSRG